MSVLSRQCLDCRIATHDDLEREVTASQSERDRASIGVKWHFTTAEARVKLHRLYPEIQT